MAEKQEEKFLVWSRGMDGTGKAALTIINPAQCNDWKSTEQRTVAVVKLPLEEHGLTLDEAIAAHPCPKYEI